MTFSQKILQFLPSIVALILVILVLLVTNYNQEKYFKVALEKESRTLLSALSNEATANIEHLSSLKRFFVSSNFIDRKEFKTFVDPILRDYPDILALSWTPEVPEEQRQSYIDLAHQDGVSDFSLKRWGHSSGWKVESEPWARHYFPVFYIEPLKDNLPALGIDLGSHKQRREAIDLALKSNSAIASNMIDLAQGGKGILVFLSIQNEGTESINQQQTRGLVSAVIKISTFFEDAIGLSEESLIDFTATENNHEGSVLYNVQESSTKFKSGLEFHTTFNFLNQNWHFNISEREAFYEVYSNNIVLYVLIVSLIFLILVLKYNLAIISQTRSIESKVASSIRDIGLKERSLSHSQMRQKIIVDSMMDGIITIDSKGVIDEFNPVAEEMFGYQKSEIAGRNIKCLMPESYSQAHDAYLSNYKETGVRHIIGSPRDTLGMHKNGTIFPINLMVSEHKTGDTSMFIGILRNLTDEQNRQAEQRAITKELESILDSAGEGICSIGSDGLIRFANRSAENMLGYEMNELEGFNFNRLIYTDSPLTTDNKETASFLEQALRDGNEASEGAELVVTKDGEVLPISYSLCPMRDKSDANGGLALVFRDNTERLAAESLIRQQHQELNAVNVELSRANKDMEQFAYVASHDLKAPLRAISNLASWVCEDLGDALTGESLENMTLLRNRVSRLDNLLTDLLAYSRAGRTDEENQDINSAAIIQDLVDLQGVPDFVEVVLADDLPVIHTNRVAFDLIVRNLLSNAVKHAGRDGVRIEISAEKQDSETIFSVADDGPGIKLEDHERIFELFTKLQSSDDVEGSGMGLSICRRAADQIGGRIWIDPEVTSGTRFAFSIPGAP